MNDYQDIPKYEFRIFGQSFQALEQLISAKSKPVGKQQMTDVYLLTAADNENNVKIRDKKMDMKVLEETFEGLERWSQYLIGDFPMETEIIRNTVFPALGIPAPTFDRMKYSLDQFLNELVLNDPDLFVAHTTKVRNEYELEGCEVEITDVTVNAACIKTICIESESYEKVLHVKSLLQIPDDTENVNYPKALKRIMGLDKYPAMWLDTTLK